MLILNEFRKDGCKKKICSQRRACGQRLQSEFALCDHGAKRIARYLTLPEGAPINPKWIVRIMREYLLNARIRKRRHSEYWYHQRHAQRLSDRQCTPYILGRNFTSVVPLKKLATDATWITFSRGHTLSQRTHGSLQPRDHLV